MKYFEIILLCLSVFCVFNASASEIKNHRFVKTWQKEKFLINKK